MCVQSDQKCLAHNRREIVGSVFFKWMESWIETGHLCPRGLPDNENSCPRLSSWKTGAGNNVTWEKRFEPLLDERWISFISEAGPLIPTFHLVFWLGWDPLCSPGLTLRGLLWGPSTITWTDPGTWILMAFLKIVGSTRPFSLCFSGHPCQP